MAMERRRTRARVGRRARGLVALAMGLFSAGAAFLPGPQRSPGIPGALASSATLLASAPSWADIPQVQDFALDLESLTPSQIAEYEKMDPKELGLDIVRPPVLVEETWVDTARVVSAQIGQALLALDFGTVGKVIGDLIGENWDQFQVDAEAGTLNWGLIGGLFFGSALVVNGARLATIVIGELTDNPVPDETQIGLETVRRNAIKAREELKAQVFNAGGQVLRPRRASKEEVDLTLPPKPS